MLSLRKWELRLEATWPYQRRIRGRTSDGIGQVRIQVITQRPRLLVNASGRATIKTGESCNVAVPLTAILYGSGGAVIQVVRRQRVETRQVEVGLMSAGQVEIKDGLTEGDIVVARAGALLREGDAVRTVTADDNSRK